MTGLAEAVLAERRIIDFADQGVTCARAGVLSASLDELIGRLAEEGLLDELLAHEWVKQPMALDRGSKPKPDGCLSALVRIVAGWWRR